MSRDPLVHRSARVRELRRAWREFWWMVVRAKPGQSLTRRVWFGLALRRARCGLLTGGEHSWGPLEYEYEGARWRKQQCRWCGAKQTPASEIDANPPGAEDMERARKMVKPTELDVLRAMEHAKAAGIYRDGRFLWE